ncbi:MAG: hypothetical protein VYA84_13090 [Planctomycetota bacterium]|nr:hypothetical protein [Planctomycetota bacterium]
MKEKLHKDFDNLEGGELNEDLNDKFEQDVEDDKENLTDDDQVESS